MNTTRSMIVIWTLAACILLMPAWSRADSIDDITLLTENYPPFNFEKDGKVQGISIDLLVEMLSRTRSSKGRRDIEVVPWTKGYKAAQNKKNTMLFATTRFEARERLFKWVGPIISDEIAVIAKKSRNIRIDTPQDLNRYKIGAVRDDVAQLLLLQAGVPPGSIYETVSGTGGENLGKMLAAGRFDLWAYSKTVAFWNLKESGFSVSEFDVVHVLKRSDLYFALHRETDDAIVAQLQKALDGIRSSGRLKEIIRNYLLGF